MTAPDWPLVSLTVPSSAPRRADLSCSTASLGGAVRLAGFTHRPAPATSAVRVSR